MDSKESEEKEPGGDDEIIGYANGIGCYWFCLACIGKGWSYHNRHRVVEAHERRALIDLKKGITERYYRIFHLPGPYKVIPRARHSERIVNADGRCVERGKCHLCGKEMMGNQDLETPTGLEWQRRENEKYGNILDNEDELFLMKDNEGETMGKETPGKDIDCTPEEAEAKEELMRLAFSQMFHPGPGTAKESIEEVCGVISSWLEENSKAEGRKLDFVCCFRVADSMEKDDTHVRAIIYGDTEIVSELFKYTQDIMNKQKGDKLNLLAAVP